MENSLECVFGISKRNLKGKGENNFFIYPPLKTLRRKWQPTPVLLPGKSHRRRTLVGYSPWGRKELDTTEQLHFLVGVRMESGGKFQGVAVGKWRALREGTVDSLQVHSRAIRP